MLKTKTQLSRIHALAGSKKAFWFLIVVFLFSALWIAFSGRYPMAFDEEFHLGIIKLYADRLNPFLVSQPSGSDAFGAVFRDPSFLYHYLMSFPWRVITAVYSNFEVQVILMRTLNVFMFAAGLFAWRRLLIRTKIPAIAINGILLAVILTPITPLIAAHINYDNLLFAIVPLFISSCINLRNGLSSKKLDAKQLLLFVGLAMFGSLIKYAFLPIAITGTVLVLIPAYQLWRSNKHSLVTSLKNSYRAMPLALKGVLIVSVGALMIIGVQRYGINAVQYRTPIPECDQVLGVERCQSYGPWARNYLYLQEKQDFAADPLWYIQFWMRRVIFNLFFAVNGYWSGYMAANPLALPKLGFVIACISALGGLVVRIKNLLKDSYFHVFFVISTAYILVLFLQNFNEYMHLGRPVAIQGRYLILVLPLLYYIMYRSIALLFGKHQKYANLLLATVLILLALGGGVLTYMARTDATWYWENPTIVRMNERAQSIVRTVIPYTD